MDQSKFNNVNTEDYLEVNWDPNEFWEMLTEHTHEEDYETNFNNDKLSNIRQKQNKEELPKTKLRSLKVPERNIADLTLFPVGKPVPKTKFQLKYNYPDVLNAGPKPIQLLKNPEIKEKIRQRGGRRARLRKQKVILEQLISISSTNEEKNIHIKKLEETKNFLNRLKKGKEIKIKN